MKSSNIADRLNLELSEIIVQIARENNIPQYEENPDFLDQRLIKWHQFGLLTHSRNVRQAFSSELVPILNDWKMYPVIEKYLAEDVDGINRQELFEISIPLHDLGKIVCLPNTGENRKHELASAALIDNGFIRDKLIAYGLKTKQLKYVRAYINNHDVLGKQLRDRLKHSGKLSLEYLDREEGRKDVRKMCKSIALSYLDISLEIGLFFICDSLGKLDMKIKPGDLQIPYYEKKIEQELRSRNIPPELRFGVIQQPVNLHLSRIYLEEALGLL